MLRSILGPAAVAMIGLAAAIGSANAQDAAVEEGYMVEEGMAPETMDAAEAAELEGAAAADQAQQEAPAPRVKGFTARRPGSCGEFKYWDGTQCADARDKKPPATQ